ncbi:MAG: 50S ribosomal protein L21 [Candidatus Omnitrophota bacterium]|jgi:large subunit ribosomal protein L21
MYAIVEVGGKQYYVEKGDLIEVEKQEFKDGHELNLSKVLLVSKDKKVEVGQPYVKGAKVLAVVMGQFRGEKSISFKYRRRKSSHWKKGHRQNLTRLEIKEIGLAG